MNKQSFPATLASFPEMMSWVRSHIAKTSLSPGEQNRVELALEEAIVNIIHHAKSKTDLELACIHIPHRTLEFVLADAGKPFNPLTYTISAKTEGSLQEREPGGIGLLLIREYMDTILYRREEDQNILTLIKNLEV